jgi:hypothetical protein
VGVRTSADAYLESAPAPKDAVSSTYISEVEEERVGGGEDFHQFIASCTNHVKHHHFGQNFIA